MQQALKESNREVPLDQRVEFRIGINLGEVVVEGEEIYGKGVNIAVRLEGVAEAGRICLSEVVYQQLKNKLALAYEDLGPHPLKNIAEFAALDRDLQELLASEVPCPGDGNLDRVVNEEDLDNWQFFNTENGGHSSWYDFNRDGVTDEQDQAVILNNLGTKCPKKNWEHHSLKVSDVILNRNAVEAKNLINGRLNMRFFGLRPAQKQEVRHKQ